MRILLLICLFFHTMTSCKIKAQSEKRKETINQVITVLKQGDAKEVIKLIDTTSFPYSEEILTSNVNYVYQQFKKCSIHLSDSSITIKQIMPHFEEYTLPFCRGENGELIDDSFDILLTFSDLSNENRIKNFEINTYNKVYEPIYSPINKN